MIARTHSPEMDRLIERQLRNWELARAQRLEKPPSTRQVQDFVAVSRQVASGGSDIARTLGERLAWPVFDHEVLHAMAGADATRERLYAWMDERDATWLEQMLTYLVGGRFPPQDYTRRLSTAVLALARGAPGVFIGRAADLILPRDHGLRIRVVAPFDMRVQRFMERSGMSAARSRDELVRVDRERSDFIRHQFHRDIDDPTRCDLTINTEHVRLNEAVDLILGLLRQRGVKPQSRAQSAAAPVREERPSRSARNNAPAARAPAARDESKKAPT